ncbi:hypothetical protein EDD21DRAFT_417247 [Dissophora ornata]|nr:hypothetical protein EDD21DRAFT_417247 [Dissophora ornata]
MADHSEKKPASGAEITLAGKHAFSKLKDAAKMAIQPSAKGHTIRNGIAAVHAQEAKFLDGPTSGAEITEVSPHSLKMSTRKDRPSGKKGDLFNRMFHRVARFPSDETIIGDSGQDQDILIRERDGGPNLSSMPRQDTAASQEDTATLVGSPHLSNLSLFSTTSFQQTAIINFSSIPHTRYEDTLVQQPFKTTFFDNIAPPFFRTPLPKPNQRFNSTLQLAYGRYLLLAKKRSLPSPMPDSLGTVEDEIQAMGLEETDRLWMSDISKDPTEQDRLRWLTAKVVCQFLKSNHKDEMSIAEVALLGSVLECQDHRDVLSFFIGQLEQESLLNEKRLLGLMQFLQSASPGYLIDDDLVRILKALYKRLEGTYIQLGDTKKPASKHIYLLAIAVSRVLDAMVEGNVKDETSDTGTITVKVQGRND